MLLPLEQQVTSVELSKKLRDLGVSQKVKHGDWAWVGDELHLVHIDNDTEWLVGNDYSVEFPSRNRAGLNTNDYVRALTVAELGELLPREIEYQASTKEKSGFDGYRSLILSFGKTIIDNGWYCLYTDPHPANKVPAYSTHADNEAEARGLMLAYLLEHKLLTI